MASFNKVILLGHLTRDVELRHLQGGSTVADVGIAVNEKYKKGNEWVEDVSFVDLTMWGRTAEIAEEYCAKGSQILVEGRLKLETWEKDGQKRSKLKVVVEKLTLLGGKGRPEGSRPAAPSSGSQEYGPPQTPPQPSSDEIPF